MTYLLYTTWEGNQNEVVNFWRTNEPFNKFWDKQKSSSSASYSEFNYASLSDDEIMIVQVELNDFGLMLQSVKSPNKRPTSSRPTTYRGDSDQTNCSRNNEINIASQVTGQTLFDV